MHCPKPSCSISLSALAATIPRSIQRQLGWLMLSTLLVLTGTLSGVLPPALAHRPHDVVTQVVLSPSYSRDQIVYALVRGNLLKSTDGGDSWKRLVQGLDTLAPPSSLTVDTTGEVLALGTQGDGIYRSQDRGESWQQANQGLTTLDVGLVYSLPSNRQIMLAAGTDSGLFRSTNGGQNWSAVTGQPIKSSISVLTEAAGQLWAGDAGGQLMRSEDSGQTWQSVETRVNDTVTALAGTLQALYVGTQASGLFRLDPNTLEVVDISQGLTDRRIRDIELLPGNPDGVMISSWDQGIAISLDQGDTWTDYPQGLIKDKQADEFETHHFDKIVLSDNFAEDQTAFLGGFNGLYKSEQAGQQWQEIETLARGVVVSMDVSPNYAIDGTLALNTYVGKTIISRDQGDTWELAMEGAEVPRFNRSFRPSYQDPRRFFDLAFSPNYAQDKTLFSSGLWTKFLRSTNGGKSWSIEALGTEARGLTLLVSPNFGKDNTLFVGTQKGLIFRSTNGGKTLTQLAQLPWERGNDSPSMVISPAFAEDQTLYVVAATGVYQSTNAGKSWQSTTENTPIATAGNVHIEISPNYAEDQTLYVSSYSGLFKSTDAGASWQRLAIAPVNPARTFLEGIALSPNYGTDGTVMISLRGQGLYKSTDGGQSFAAIGDASLAFSRLYNVPCAGRPIQFSPNYGEDTTVFGFGTTGTEVYRSTDGGNTWEILTAPDVEPPLEVTGFKRWIIAAELYRGRVLKGLLAVVAALVAYGVAGVARLDKRVPFNQTGVQVTVGLMTFAIALVAVFKFL